MKKKLNGTTLIYDATDEAYLRTEIYMSDNPDETVDLCVVDEDHPRFSDGEIDASSGPWRRIIEPKEDQGDANEDPVLLEENQIRPNRIRSNHIRKDQLKARLEKNHLKKNQLHQNQSKSVAPRRRTPTKVLPDKKPMPNKPVWVSFEAEVLDEDRLLRVPERLHLLARASGERVDIRMRLVPNEDAAGTRDTLEGLPTIGRDQ